MFKRINKRQKRLAKEEELGLDAETKQVLGLNETDSDESFSAGSDSEKSDFGNESDDEEASMVDERMALDETLRLNGRLSKRKRGRSTGGSSSEEEEDGENGDDSELAYSEVESLEDEDMVQDQAPMSISSALKNPIYDVPVAPKTQETQDTRACVICPKKLLKNDGMVKVHLQSKSHVRRMRRFTAEVRRLETSPNGLETDDPSSILDNLPKFNTSASTETGTTSKRSQKKAEWKAKFKEKLTKRKEERRVNAPAAPIKKEPVNVAKKEKGTDMPNKDASLSVPSASKHLLKLKPATKTEQPAEGHPRKKIKGNTHSESIASETLVKGISFREKPQSGATSKLNLPPLVHRNTSLYFADDEKNRDSAASDIPYNSKMRNMRKKGSNLLKAVGVKKHKDSRESSQKIPKTATEKSKSNPKS